MFNKDFYPTPETVIEQMLCGTDVQGKVVLEPSAGKGNIVDYLKLVGAKEVIACESNQELLKILRTKCRVIAEDFLAVTPADISHIDVIVMNPPFSADCQHIIHAFEIAPAGCEIVALCNWQTWKNAYSQSRVRLAGIIEQNGSILNIGECFQQAERTTDVTVGLIRLRKPGVKDESEFEGFFMEEEEDVQSNGIMSYNIVRDLVNRYVAAVKLYDEQLSVGERMSNLTKAFYHSQLAFSCTVDEKPLLRNDFKKDLQKSAWGWIFKQMNMDKHATQGLKEDINKFVEQQHHVPFTMRNIYKMIEIVIGTTSSRMDKAIMEVFTKLTQHYHENRYNVEGWKTNSHYLMGEKFIMPGICYQDKWSAGSNKISLNYRGLNTLEDLIKAMCYITGENYDKMEYFQKSCDRSEYGQLFDWTFFEVRCYKKGTAHFKFKNRDHWALLNQNVARILGYPLPESLAKK